MGRGVSEDSLLGFLCTGSGSSTLKITLGDFGPGKQ